MNASHVNRLTSAATMTAESHADVEVFLQSPSNGSS